MNFFIQWVIFEVFAWIVLLAVVQIMLPTSKNE